MSLYIVYLGGALYGTLQLEQGVNKRAIGPDGSYLTTYYEVEDEYFRKYPYRIQVRIKNLC